MLFKRKVYKKIKDRKDKYTPNYACLLEGARRVGKTTLAINFAKNEYKSYILIDFSIVKKEILNLFADISDLNYFFMQLQLFTDVKLYERESVIIFDEIQLFLKARQAIKHLLKDGRYDYFSLPLYVKEGTVIVMEEDGKRVCHIYGNASNTEACGEYESAAMHNADGTVQAITAKERL